MFWTIAFFRVSIVSEFSSPVMEMVMGFSMDLCMPQTPFLRLLEIRLEWMIVPPIEIRMLIWVTSSFKIFSKSLFRIEIEQRIWTLVL